MTDVSMFGIVVVCVTYNLVLGNETERNHFQIYCYFDNH